ncbi:uncharacterized protein ARMOST_19496 [Armillaria ostoyae]|uniref:Uncharacterized protein n=1 Tax=Armillaria ostoyae TaxID=47428 RepID=A0A284S4Q0_ARMOS|nr:uncharacterized protein ARMOST_19496 [Armillaria ostoyae]
MRVYNLFHHFLGALHFDPFTPNSAQFLPDDPYHRVTCIIDHAAYGIIHDYKVYFDISVQYSLHVILVI